MAARNARLLRNVPLKFGGPGSKLQGCGSVSALGEVRLRHRDILAAAFVLAPVAFASRGETADATHAFESLYSFASQLSNLPSQPAGGLIFGPKGSFYGVTSYGGAPEYGTVFELQESNGTWQANALYAFGTNEGDGLRPENTVAMGADGTLYGTTTVGGTYSHGTIYALSPPHAPGGGWTETTLYNFGNGSDGQYPSSGVVVDSNGVLYGVTVWGGTDGVGIAYALAPPVRHGGAWTETVLHNFTGSLKGPSADGAWPYGNLTIASSGRILGTTYYGGSGNCPYTCGVVFELKPGKGQDWSEKIAYNFQGQPSDGEAPFSGVTMGADGTLYGTTYKGGTYNDCLLGCGIVFALKPAGKGGDWSETVIHEFTSDDYQEGINPIGMLTPGKAGVLYGTTQYGGGQSYYCDISCGTVFALKPSRNGSWTETVLHNFTDQNGDGEAPTGTLIIGRRGILFGTTPGGGLDTGGTAFQLKP